MIFRYYFIIWETRISFSFIESWILNKVRKAAYVSSIYIRDYQWILATGNCREIRRYSPAHNHKYFRISGSWKDVLRIHRTSNDNEKNKKLINNVEFHDQRTIEYQIIKVTNDNVARCAAHVLYSFVKIADHFSIATCVSTKALETVHKIVGQKCANTFKLLSYAKTNDTRTFLLVIYTARNNRT